MTVAQGENWHYLSVDSTVSLLDSHPERGLDQAEAEERLAHFGPNEISERRGDGPLKRFLLQFHQPLIYILLGATAVTIFLGEYVDAAVIFAVVLINAVIGFVQESKALQAIQALQKSLAVYATVIRSGKQQRLPVEKIVPGDIVELAAGDRVPADMRLIRVYELQTDESALTGESVPVQKEPRELEVNTDLGDRKNMAYSSSLVTRGAARGVVVAAGDNTEIGRIAEMVSRAEQLETPLTRRIREFSHILLIAILSVAAIAFIVGLIRGESAAEMFLAATALAVGMIPEGLPAVVTIILAIGVSRMARRRAIVRTLPSVETLGSTTVICSDKTGTLTQNQMTVLNVLAGGRKYALSGVGFSPSGEIRLAEGPAAGKAEAANDLGAEKESEEQEPVSLGEHPVLERCLSAAMLCNDSELYEEEGQWQVDGDPTEGAMLAAARKAGLDREQLQESFPRIDELPFESERQYMATLHQRGPDKPPLVFIKGSVERLLPRCEDAWLGDGEQRVESIDREKVLADVERMTRQGLRVLAIAQKELAPGTDKLTHAEIEDGLMYLGLQGMIDPPRPEAIEAVEACKVAGVDVKMITGDHAGTASAIAAKLGIGTQRDGPHPEAVTSRQLAEMDDEQLAEVVRKTHVFARVSPEHKLRLVEAIQQHNEVVAMTGDGVNDAPALRRANIGVAMGLTGTEVARETSDIVLTDDNFATIVAAVEEGRNVFRNLTKYIVWTLPTNGAEGLIILTGIVLGTILPLLPVQVLWVNMTTAIFLGLMLAFEPKESDLMKRPPRRPNAPLFNRPLIMRTAFVSILICAAAFALFQWELARGASAEVARTVATTTVIICKSFYLLNCRSLAHSIFTVGLFSNPWIWVGIALMISAQLLFIYTPMMNFLFNTAPIAMDAWGLIVLSGVAIYVIVAVEKAITVRANPEIWR